MSKSEWYIVLAIIVLITIALVQAIASKRVCTPRTEGKIAWVSNGEFIYIPGDTTCTVVCKSSVQLRAQRLCCSCR